MRMNKGILPSGAIGSVTDRCPMKAHSVTKQTANLMPEPESRLEYPFITPAFFRALEETGAATAETGWQREHLREAGVWMPLYAKWHSRGEYVFDYAWADAWERQGRPWYPKLVTSVPFTPVPGPRWRGRLRDPDALLEAVGECAARTGASSWHLLFPDRPTLEALADLPLVRRDACHFRWFNRGYGDFDAFLGELVSRKRKSLRRERRRVTEQGLTVERRCGHDIPEHWWQAFYRFYVATYLKRGQHPYLGPEFMAAVARDLAEQVMMVMAFHDGEPAAAALYFFDSERLYGRYWGCLREFDALHFELCYYQGIDFAIEQGLAEFDPGVQGEHKILRGFEPVILPSLHWLPDERFRLAVGDFCRREARAVEAYRQEAASLLPYRAC